MNISVVSTLSDAGSDRLCVLPVFDDVLQNAVDVAAPLGSESALFVKLVSSGVISGKAITHYFIPAGETGQSVLVLALGDRAKLGAEVVRRAIGASIETLQTNKASSLVVLADAIAGFVPAVIDGVSLGQYQFRRYKTDDDEPVLVTDVAIVLAESDATVVDALEASALVCANSNWARDLANTPGADMTPTILSDICDELAKELSCKIDVIDEAGMRKKGMNALLAVSQGSPEPARLIVMSYEGKPGGKTVALVGKGISFDTGGISLKPGTKMEDMKFDMCGAAAVLGAFKSICELAPEINVVCAVPSAENMPGTGAVKPGDIVTAYNGKTIEIYNTDAEGRLVLADALSYVVDTYKPDVMVDLATLTGACIVALGHYAAAVMGTSDDITLGLQVAADKTGERIWPMPLWDDFNELIKGHDADVCNLPEGRQAGTVTAGCFLKHFTGDTPWVHMDIAGTAWGQPHIPYLDNRLATGFGVRLLTDWVLGMSGSD